MNSHTQQPGLVRRYLVDVRSVLLGWAIFNFITAYMMYSKVSFLCGMCLGYSALDYLREPVILLVAAIFLRTNRWWGNTIALLASGCIIGYFAYVLLISNNPALALMVDCRLTRPGYVNILSALTSYYPFAVIVFSFSAVSLRRNLFKPV
ncbi:MAG TPA: hypothetical protein VJR02_04165 [Pyrinomonadaceae bacterium]|nr:hypothetical protein [Pyrinomonadaceae bacterium]